MATIRVEINPVIYVARKPVAEWIRGAKWDFTVNLLWTKRYFAGVPSCENGVNHTQTNQAQCPWGPLFILEAQLGFANDYYKSILTLSTNDGLSQWGCICSTLSERHWFHQNDAHLTTADQTYRFLYPTKYWI